MKKIMILLVTLMVAIASCDKDTPKPDPDNGNGNGNGAGQGTTALGTPRPTGVFSNTASWKNLDSLRLQYAKAIRDVLKLTPAQLPDVEFALVQGGTAVTPSLQGIGPLLNEDILIDLLSLVKDGKFKDLGSASNPNLFFAAGNQEMWGKLTPPWRSARSGQPAFFWWIQNRFVGPEVGRTVPGAALLVGVLDDKGQPAPNQGATILCYLRGK